MLFYSPVRISFSLQRHQCWCDKQGGRDDNGRSHHVVTNQRVLQLTILTSLTNSQGKRPRGTCHTGTSDRHPSDQLAETRCIFLILSSLGLAGKTLLFFQHHPCSPTLGIRTWWSLYGCNVWKYCALVTLELDTVVAHQVLLPISRYGRKIDRLPC